MGPAQDGQPASRAACWAFSIHLHYAGSQCNAPKPVLQRSWRRGSMGFRGRSDWAAADTIWMLRVCRGMLRRSGMAAEPAQRSSALHGGGAGLCKQAVRLPAASRDQSQGTAIGHRSARVPQRSPTTCIGGSGACWRLAGASATAKVNHSHQQPPVAAPATTSRPVSAALIG